MRSAITCILVMGCGGGTTTPAAPSAESPVAPVASAVSTAPEDTGVTVASALPVLRDAAAVCGDAAAAAPLRRVACAVACTKGGDPACLTWADLESSERPPPTSDEAVAGIFAAGCATPQGGLATLGAPAPTGPACVKLDALLARAKKDCLANAEACAHWGDLAFRFGRARPDADLDGALRTACDKSDARSCTRLGVLLAADDSPLPNDPKAARSSFDKACAAKDAEACCHLAYLARMGQGMPKSAQNSQAYEKKANELAPSSCTLSAKSLVSLCADCVEPPHFSIPSIETAQPFLRLTVHPKVAANAPEGVRKRLESSGFRFMRCYRDKLASDPSLEGEVAVRANVAKDGTIASIEAQTGAAALQACAKTALVGTDLGEDAANATFDVTISFSRSS